MKLEAMKREPGKSGELRRTGRIPAVIYNQEVNESISIEMRAFDKAFREQGTSSLIDLDVEGTVYPVLVKQVQMNKRRREPMHVDFFAITANQAVEVNVPIEFVGTAPAQVDAFPGETFTGTIRTINPVVDQTTRTARVTVGQIGIQSMSSLPMA